MLAFVTHISAANCPAGMIYNDCYRKECELNCENVRHPESCLTDQSNICFPGCYCPDGMVKDQNTCKKPKECKNCNCEIKMGTKLTSFDGYSLQLKPGVTLKLIGVDKLSIETPIEENKVGSILISIYNSSYEINSDSNSQKVRCSCYKFCSDIKLNLISFKLHPLEGVRS